MNKIKIKKNLYLYQFPPLEGSDIGQNIIVLENDDECIVFDSGYERHMEEVKPLLTKKIKHLILTHYHPDHSYGQYILTGMETIGSKYAKDTLEIFDKAEDSLLLPKIVVKDEMNILFGKHKINLQINQGHSLCGLLISIDNDVLLVGDDIMYTNDGRSILPYVAETLDMHIHSLQRIYDACDNKIIIPSHGMPTSDTGKIKHDIMIKIKYLEFCKTRNPNLDVFKKEHDVIFEMEKWHSSNHKRD